jgi:hypothetical protein
MEGHKLIATCAYVSCGPFSTMGEKEMFLSEATVAATLPASVGQHIARIEKSKASKPFLEAFDTFVRSRARSALGHASPGSLAESAAWASSVTQR